MITLNVNFEMSWCDDLLKWNTTDQTCLRGRNRTQIFFTADEIWTPDIVASNGPGKTWKRSKSLYPILAICTGYVKWSYQDKVVSFCKIIVTYFPFDRQYCSIDLQSTIYDSSEFKLRTLYNVVRLYKFITTEWEISHATIEEIDLYNPHYARNFSTIRINIELERRSRFYVIKIICPFSIIAILALFSFCLPTDSGEKIAMCISILLSLTIYIQIISDYVPKTERGICALTLYSNLIFLLVFLSCVFNISTVFIYYHEIYTIRNRIPQRHDQQLLIDVHQSLIELNKQRWTFLRRRLNLQQHLPEQTDIDATKILYDIRYIRELLANLHQRQQPNHILIQFLSSHRSFKQLSLLIDRILFFIYLLSIPLCFLILYIYNNPSRLPSSTNQLRDLRQTEAVDPLPLIRGCP